MYIFFRIIHRDDHCFAKDGVAAVVDLVANEGIHALIGPRCTSGKTLGFAQTINVILHKTNVL